MSSTARLNASKGAMPLATPRSRVLGVCVQRQGKYRALYLVAPATVT